MTTDRLALAHVIEDAGIARDGAERVAAAIFDAIHDNVATKQDIAAVRLEMAAMEQRLTLRFAQLERRIDQVVTRVGLIAVILLILLFAALHYWPPGRGGPGGTHYGGASFHPALSFRTERAR